MVGDFAAECPAPGAMPLGAMAVLRHLPKVGPLERSPEAETGRRRRRCTPTARAGRWTQQDMLPQATVAHMQRAGNSGVRPAAWALVRGPSWEDARGLAEGYSRLTEGAGWRQHLLKAASPHGV